MKIPEPWNRPRAGRERTGRRLRVLCLALVLASSGPLLAERADRDKPVTLEADRVEIDDQTFRQGSKFQYQDDQKK